MSAHFDAAEVLAVEANLGGDHTDICQHVYPSLLVPTPEQEMTGQRPEGKRLMVRSTVRCCEAIDLPIRHPSSPDIIILIGHLLPDVTWSTLGSEHLPLPSPSLIMPSRYSGKLFPARTFARLTEKDSQQSQSGDSLKHPCLPPAMLEKKN